MTICPFLLPLLPAAVLVTMSALSSSRSKAARRPNSMEPTKGLAFGENPIVSLYFNPPPTPPTHRLLLRVSGQRLVNGAVQLAREKVEDAHHAVGGRQHKALAVVRKAQLPGLGFDLQGGGGMSGLVWRAKAVHLQQLVEVSVCLVLKGHVFGELIAVNGEGVSGCDPASASSVLPAVGPTPVLDHARLVAGDHHVVDGVVLEKRRKLSRNCVPRSPLLTSMALTGRL